VLARRDRDERGLLARWDDDAPDALAVLDDDDDRATLRAAVRGVAAHASSSARRAAATTTAALPEAALADLAAATSGAEVAMVLGLFDHPAAGALAPLLAAAPLDLVAIELALARWFAGRALARAHDHALAAHVAQVLDVDAARAALLLATRGRELDAEAHWIAGGALVDRATFLTAARAATPFAAATVLGPAFAGTPVAAALGPDVLTRPGELERAALQWHLATQTALRRREPLGLAPLLWLLLHRRVERDRLRRAAWRLVMARTP
ncbi:MAG TPA: V-type ATPase subunit, partial [Kofleriaceae bacterium]|nr:V-type ATPase subunit [Kofleriaceae bacterium]